MPAKCLSCVRLREDIKNKSGYIVEQKDSLGKHKLTIAEYLKEIKGLRADVAAREDAEIITTVDLTEYFFKVDRLVSLFVTDDKETFALEVNNFKTLLSQIRRENDKTT